jgi:hypothetical protein
MGQEPEVELQADAFAVAHKVNDPPGTTGLTAQPGSSVVTIPAGYDASGVPIWQQQNQGAECCGCCCDFRRAVIFVSIISICIVTGAVITLTVNL